MFGSNFLVGGATAGDKDFAFAVEGLDDLDSAVYRIRFEGDSGVVAFGPDGDRLNERELLIQSTVSQLEDAENQRRGRDDAAHWALHDAVGATAQYPVDAETPVELAAMQAARAAAVISRIHLDSGGREQTLEICRAKRAKVAA